MNQFSNRIHPLSRRSFLQGAGLGAAALAGLDGRMAVASASADTTGMPHFAPKAKRAICLYQLGGPSQLEMWDYICYAIGITFRLQTLFIGYFLFMVESDNVCVVA